MKDYSLKKFFCNTRNKIDFFEEGDWNSQNAIHKNRSFGNSLNISDILNEYFKLTFEQQVELVKSVYDLYQLRNGLVHGRLNFNELTGNYENNFQNYIKLISALNLKFQNPQYPLLYTLYVNPLAIVLTPTTGNFIEIAYQLLHEKDLYKDFK